jgi:hypothetical protein
MTICGKRAGKYELMTCKLSFRLLLLVAILLTCAIIAGCKSADKYQRQIEQNLVTSLEYWGTSWNQKPWYERSSDTPKELLQYITQQNKIDGFSEMPVAVETMPEILLVLKELDISFSPMLRKLLQEKLIGIFCVKDLGSSGFTEEITDVHSDKTYALIVLDRDVLRRRKANDWATWKENSIFRHEETDTNKLRMIIEPEKSDTVQNAIRYLLLHELGHALGAISKSHMSWKPSENQPSIKYPFAALSWRSNEKGELVSLFDDKFPERQKIHFYAFEKAQLANTRMKDAYDKLQSATNFVSMQAAVNIWEDFAESFATYIHVIRDRKPWEIRIEDGKSQSFVIRSCWEEARCREKKAFFDKWFAQQ